MAPGLLQGIKDYRWDMPNLNYTRDTLDKCVSHSYQYKTSKKVAMVRERSNHEGVCSSRNIRRNELGLMAVKNLTK